MDHNDQGFPYLFGAEDWGFDNPYNNEPTPYDDLSSHHQNLYYNNKLNFNHFHGESAYAELPDYHFDANYAKHVSFNTDVSGKIQHTDAAEEGLIASGSVDMSLAKKENATNSEEHQFKCQNCDKYTGKTAHNLKEHVRFTHIGDRCMWNDCNFQGTEFEVREHLRSTHATKIPISDATNDVAKSPRYKCNWEFKDGSKCAKTFARFDGVVRDHFHHNRELCIS
ncbi:hypothetical protein F4811DRAFT_557021 [Daldinia bambusicola]|nr:hypothetical protein F4811DRAFT_557021 [Daldinia bambusicola]